MVLVVTAIVVVVVVLGLTGACVVVGAIVVDAGSARVQAVKAATVNKTHGHGVLRFM
jgi:hypothetical protein